MVDIKIASFNKRAMALIIDWVIISIMIMIIGDVFIALTEESSSLMKNFADSIWLFIPIFYYCFFHGCFGATLGKMILGLKVVDYNGTKISYMRAIYRYSIYSIVLITIFISTVFYPSEYPFSNLISKYEKLGQQLAKEGITEEKYEQGLLTKAQEQKIEGLKKQMEKEFEEESKNIDVLGTIRYLLFGPILYFICGLIDVLVFLSRDRKQALHDIVGKTYVVDIR